MRATGIQMDRRIHDPAADQPADTSRRRPPVQRAERLAGRVRSRPATGHPTPRRKARPVIRRRGTAPVRDVVGRAQVEANCATPITRMSRAFVKEAENDSTELPDRPVSPHRNFVTEAGLAAIEAALGRVEGVLFIKPERAKAIGLPISPRPSVGPGYGLPPNGLRSVRPLVSPAVPNNAIGRVVVPHPTPSFVSPPGAINESQQDALA
jgi:hypothetical protein